MTKKNIKFWLDDDLHWGIKNLARCKFTTVSALMRVACKAMNDYHTAEICEQEKLSREKAAQAQAQPKARSGSNWKISRREFRRLVAERRQDAFDYAAAAISLELERQEKKID